MTDTTPTGADAVLAEAFSTREGYEAYWSSQSAQARVRDAVVSDAQRGTDVGREVVTAPQEAPSSLAPALLEKGLILQELAADKSSIYWHGGVLGGRYMSAEEIQALSRDLIRGELAGETGPVALEQRGADVDMPAKASGYQLDGLPVYDAQTRDVVDLALTHLHDAGFGQARAHDLLDWSMQQPAWFSHPDYRREAESSFRSWAKSKGWTDQHIRHAISVYSDMRKQHR